MIAIQRRLVPIVLVPLKLLDAMLKLLDPVFKSA